MLTANRLSDAVKVIACDTNKKEGPFYCPICGSETILHKGPIKIAHFAHKPPAACEYGRGESERHRQCKQEVYTLLSKECGLSVELEKNLGTVVPDIYIDFGEGKPKVAIEVQISCLTMERIIERTRDYNRLDVYVLWLPLYSEALEQERYTPKAWERWLHAAYFGRVYYWTEGLSVTPVHFDEHQLYVAESEWYDSKGHHYREGGYYKKSKRFRSPKKGEAIDLTKDFTVMRREAWSGGYMLVPECKLLIDEQPKWWLS